MTNQRCGKDKSKTSPVIPDLIWNAVWSNNTFMDSSIHWNDKSEMREGQIKTSPVIPDLIWNPVWSNNTFMDSSLRWKDKSEMREGQIENKSCHSRLDLKSSVEQQYLYGFQYTLE